MTSSRVTIPRFSARFNASLGDTEAIIRHPRTWGRRELEMDEQRCFPMTEEETLEA